MEDMMEEEDNKSIQSETEMDILISELEQLTVKKYLDPYAYFDGPIETSEEEDEFAVMDDEGPV